MAFLKKNAEMLKYMNGKQLGGIIYGSWPSRLPFGEDKRVFLDRSVASMREVVKTVEDCNVFFNVEVVNRFEQFLLNTAAEGVAYVKRVGSAHCRVLLDTFHLNIEEDSIRDAIVGTGSRLGHFHIGETNRRPPGRGRMPWTEIFAALRAIDYKGAITGALPHAGRGGRPRHQRLPRPEAGREPRPRGEAFGRLRPAWLGRPVPPVIALRTSNTEAMKRRNAIGRGILSAVGLSLAAARLSAAGEDPRQEALACLWGVVHKDSGWTRIHAAESLIRAGTRESSAVQALFLAELPSLERSTYRIGAWRVLAETAPSDEDRNQWIGKIEDAFVDSAAVDRPNALESLGKLRARLTGPVLDEARTWAEADGPKGVLGLWNLYFGGDLSALTRLDEALRSPDAEMRRDAAYAFRWMQVSTPRILRDLARTADAEPTESSAYVYVVSAAFALRADPGRLDHWRSMLETVLFKGSTDYRFEAAQASGPLMTRADIPRLLPLLTRPASDDRTAGCVCLLYVEQASP